MNQHDSNLIRKLVDHANKFNCINLLCRHQCYTFYTHFKCLFLNRLSSNDRKKNSREINRVINVCLFEFRNKCDICMSFSGSYKWMLILKKSIILSIEILSAKNMYPFQGKRCEFNIYCIYT